MSDMSDFSVGVATGFARDAPVDLVVGLVRHTPYTVGPGSANHVCTCRMIMCAHATWLPAGGLALMPQVSPERHAVMVSS